MLYRIKKPFFRFRMKGFGVRQQKVNELVQSLREDGVLAFQGRQQQVQAWRNPFIVKVPIAFMDVG
jgi:hypothetical protein